GGQDEAAFGSEDRRHARRTRISDCPPNGDQIPGAARHPRGAATQGDRPRRTGLGLAHILERLSRGAQPPVTLQTWRAAMNFTRAITPDERRVAPATPAPLPRLASPATVGEIAEAPWMSRMSLLDDRGRSAE